MSGHDHRGNLEEEEEEEEEKASRPAELQRGHIASILLQSKNERPGNA